MRYEIVEWPPGTEGLNRGRSTIYSLFDKHQDRHVTWNHDLEEVRRRKVILEEANGR